MVNLADRAALPAGFHQNGMGSESNAGGSACLVLGGPLPCHTACAVLGRWSLSFYMLHQPLLIGALTGLQALR